MTNPSIQKVLESFDEKFESRLCYQHNRVEDNLMEMEKSFLAIAFEEIAQAEYKRGYDEAYAKIPNPCYSQEEVDRLSKVAQQDLEKAKLRWGDIGYRNGVEAAKEKIIEADKQIGDCYPFLTTKNEADKEQMDKYNKMVYFFFHKTMENTLASLNELLTDKS